MKATVSDPWNESGEISGNFESSFEDSFTDIIQDQPRLPDSEEYLERLYNRLKSLQKGSSKRDLVNSLSEAKEDCIARLIRERRFLETEEEQELAANPMIRLVAPHLQALTASELVHLLEADVLELTASEESPNFVDDNENDTSSTSTLKEN